MTKFAGVEALNFSSDGELFLLYRKIFDDVISLCFFLFIPFSLTNVSYQVNWANEWKLGVHFASVGTSRA